VTASDLDDPHRERRRLVLLGAAGVALTLTLVLSVAPVAQAADSLTVVSGAEGEHPVVLTRRSDDTLNGILNLVVRNTTGQSAQLVVNYLPTDGVKVAQAGSVAVFGESRPTIQIGPAVGVSLRLTLPRDGSPSDLAGILTLQLEQGKKPVGDAVDLQVKGVPDPLAGVTVVPQDATLEHTNTWPWPISRPDHDTLNVQLRGPGVPSLFRPGQQVPKPQVPLSSAQGTELRATLTQLAPTSDPAVANGVLSVDGSLDPGTYSGTLPLSDLSADSPKFTMTVHSRDAFVWALLAAFLGALLGGFVYLASNVSRRKALLRAYVRGVLDRYSAMATTLRTGADPGQFPLWNLDEYLRSPQDWYRVEWTAVPELDGVKGTWSSIYWARNDADLDEVTGTVTGLRERVLRWLRAADTVSALEEVVKLEPRDPPDAVWARSKTVGDSKLLLRRLRELEPPDDATAQALISRIRRQARWHAALAHTWNMKTEVLADATTNPQNYNDDARESLKAMDLAALDEKACPEQKRIDDDQLPLEEQLDTFEARLKEVYRGGDPADLEEIAGPDRAVHLGVLSAAEARPGAGAKLALWSSSSTDITPISEVETRDARQPSKRGRDNSQGIIMAIVRRDLVWTMAIALMTTAAYVPIFYGSAWGTPGDYGSAFVAGFVGKLVINWALLPAFHSLRLGTSQGQAGVTQATSDTAVPAQPQATPQGEQAPVAPADTGPGQT
jgi:hypothetical protein